MTRVQSIISTLIGLLVLVLLAVGLAWLLKAQQRLPPQAVASQEGATLSQDSPLPMPTLVLTPPTPEYPPDYEGPGMPLRTPIPTPTVPPVPTPVPMPSVTPAPLAKPPYLPGLESVVPQPFRVLAHEGNQLFALASDGGERKLLLDSVAQLELYLDFQPYPGIEGSKLTWGRASPDGKKLALVLTDVPCKESPQHMVGVFMYLFDLETGELRQLSKCAEPSWSPLSDRIACNTPEGLTVVNVNSGENHVVFTPAQDYGVEEVAWSPDGGRLALVHAIPPYLDAPQLLLVSADGMGQPQLLDVPGLWNPFNLTWSADGKSLLFVCAHRDPATAQVFHNICRLDLENGNLQMLTKEASVLAFAPSPTDGDWLAFTGIFPYEYGEVAPDAPTFPKYDLWLLNINTLELLRLTKSQEDFIEPWWSPDGTQLVLRRLPEGALVFDLKSGSVRELAPGLSDFVVAR